MSVSLEAGAGLERLAEVVRTLRGENGCPWDREQDATSILDYLLEEAYEVVEAVRSGKAGDVREELGDVIMEVVFLARIYEEQGAFTLAESIESIIRKLILRHPHVFGTEKLDSPQSVLEAWHKRKKEEKSQAGLLDGQNRFLPALAAAYQIGARVSSVGFDWPRPEGALDKLREELAELGRALEAGDREKIEHEVGDVLFAAANVSRRAGINPETALLGANARFRGRFAHIEARLRETGREPGQAALEELDALWEEAKSGGR